MPARRAAPSLDLLRARCWQRDIADRELAASGRDRLGSLAGCSVKAITRDEAARLIERYEWMGTMPRGRVAQYGLIAADGELLGAVIFGRGGGTAAADLCGPNFRNRAICLQRGACVPWAPKNAASFLVSRASRLAHRDHGWLVVYAYHDPAAGEVGTIYQALNAVYIGARTGRLAASQWRPAFLHRLSGRWFSEKAIRARTGRVDSETGGRRAADLRADPDWLALNRPERGRYVWFLGLRKERREARAALRYPALAYPQRVMDGAQPMDLRQHIAPARLARHEADQAAITAQHGARRRRRSEKRAFLNAGPQPGPTYPVGLRAAIYQRGKTGRSADDAAHTLGMVVAKREWSLVGAFLNEQPGLWASREALLMAAERGELDVVVVPSVTDFACSLTDLLDVLGRLHQHGVGLHALDGSLDTLAPADTAMLGALGILQRVGARFASENARVGAVKARAAGVRLGRPPLDEAQAKMAIELLSISTGVRETARKTGLSLATVSGLLRRLRGVQEAPPVAPASGR